MSIREIQVSGNTLQIHQRDSLCDPVTGRVNTGSWIWGSALTLSEFISIQDEFEFKGKFVLELGAGAGLPGMTAALLGANRVMLTDIRSLLPSLKKNVEINGLEDRVDVRELVWGESTSRDTELDEFDFVLMSDVFYDVALMCDLAKTLKMVCGKETVVFAASEVRTWTHECLNELVSHGFGVVELPSQLELIGTSGSDDVFCMYRLFLPS